MSVVEKDPVCGMVVDADKIEGSYAGVHYAFCSDQCLERLLMSFYKANETALQRNVSLKDF